MPRMPSTSTSTVFYAFHCIILFSLVGGSYVDTVYPNTQLGSAQHRTKTFGVRTVVVVAAPYRVVLVLSSLNLNIFIASNHSEDFSLLIAETKFFGWKKIQCARTNFENKCGKQRKHPNVQPWRLV